MIFLSEKAEVLKGSIFFKVQISLMCCDGETCRLFIGGCDVGKQMLKSALKRQVCNG